MVNLSLAPTGITTSGSCHVKQLPLSLWYWASGFQLAYSCEAVGLQDYCGEGGGNRANWTSTKFTVLKKIQPFFLNKCSLKFYKSFITFWSSEDFYFDNFFQCFCTFVEKFRCFYSTILEVFLHVLALHMHSMLC